LFKEGIFIVLEGIEGSGKGEQIKHLSAYFSERKLPLLTTWEPGGTSLGKRIREILLFGPPISAEAELFLYLSDRAQHVREVIIPALKEGKIVICDRYYPSTLAYQGYGRGLDIEKIKKMNQWATQGLEPQVIILIDVPVEVAIRRIQRRSLDRLEREEISFHEKVRNGYLLLAAKEQDKYLVIDGQKTPEEVFQEIISGLKEKIPAFSNLL